MQMQQLPSFSALANGQRASTMVPAYAQSLAKVSLKFGGNLTKANITEIVGKIGARTFFGPISATHLDLLMKYRGQYDHANFLSLDLTERDALTLGEKEVGAIDLPGLGGDAVFVEVLNSAGAGTPTLEGLAGFVGRQFVDRDGDGVRSQGEQNRRQQLIHKLLRFSLPNTGTRNVWQPMFRGAIVKRLFIVYTGTDWTGSANGNVHTVEVKRNGVSVHDRVQCLANRFHQLENGKVPQSRTYVVDFCADNNFRAGLQTASAKSLEVIMDMTTAEAPTVYAEVLDLPDNL